jgi:uncharacterized protein YcnI
LNGKRIGRPPLVALVLGLGLAAVPGTAWAHAVFLSDSHVPANSDQKLQMNVPEEKGPDVHNTKIVVVVPSGFRVSGCDQRPDFSCSVSPASQGRTLVTFTRTSGSDPDGRFSYAVHTPGQSGGYPFNTNQTYSDGSTVHWDGPPNSDTPAPVLQVG